MKVKNMVLILLLMFFLPMRVFAFCGFYVAKADTKLFNKSSKVVIARQKDRTVVTMSNDYSGKLNEFATVIPVPTVLERKQIHIGNQKNIDHLDAYSAPRLVEYHDSDPCNVVMYGMMEKAASPNMMKNKVRRGRAKKLGVKIEAEYTVGEYDIVILSAKKSDGLQTWLSESGYKVPAKAKPVLKSYIKQGMKFFVAKVNLKEQEKTGFQKLRPLQVAYESEKFMLPIRLGMVNSKDDRQDLFVFILSSKGKVETKNYRTVKIPTDKEIPAYIKSEKLFTKFYQDMFKVVSEKENYRVVFWEYGWDMNWCDPCAADPLSSEQLRSLGAFWIAKNSNSSITSSKPTGNRVGRPILPPRGPRPQNIYLTRLHLRYGPNEFPEDLFFQETSDRSNFQGRYIIRHAWKGSENSCSMAKSYLQGLGKRQAERANTLATLTGWDITDIRKKMSLQKEEAPKKKKWWEDLWGSIRLKSPGQSS